MERSAGFVGAAQSRKRELEKRLAVLRYGTTNIDELQNAEAGGEGKSRRRYPRVLPKYQILAPPKPGLDAASSRGGWLQQSSRDTKLKTSVLANPARARQRA